MHIKHVDYIQQFFSKFSCNILIIDWGVKINILR